MLCCHLGDPQGPLLAGAGKGPSCPQIQIQRLRKVVQGSCGAPKRSAQERRRGWEGWWWVGSFIFDYQAKAAFCLKQAWPFPVPRAFAPDLHGILSSQRQAPSDNASSSGDHTGPKVRLPARGGQWAALGYLVPSLPTGGLWPGGGGRGRVLVLGGGGTPYPPESSGRRSTCLSSLGMCPGLRAVAWAAPLVGLWRLLGKEV